MPLPLILDAAAFESLPDARKTDYKKKDDGKFHLDIEGVVPREKLEEFRSSNVGLKEQIEKLTKDVQAFEGIDPAVYKQFMDKFKTDEEKKLIKDGNIDEVVKLRTEAIRKDFSDQLAAKEKVITKLTDDTKKATGDKDTYIVENELRKAVDATGRGFQPGVADLLKDRVLKEFIHKEGKVVRVKPDGSLVYGKSGDPEGISEFVSSYAKEHPYLVIPSSGGNAQNDTTKGSRSNGQKTMPMAEFNKLDAEAKNKFIMIEKGVPVDA